MIQDMEKSNMDFIMDVFKTITGELPEMMLYREDGDSMELRSTASKVAWQWICRVMAGIS